MLAIGLGASMAFACENSPAPAPSARELRESQSASAVPLYVPPPPEGCARTGPLEGVEADPTCVVTAPSGGDDVAMREAMRHLTFELKPDAPVVVAGGTMLLRLTIANGKGSETALLLDMLPPGAGPRPDWTRLAGVPEPKPAMSGAPAVPEGFRLVMPIRTLDAREHSVDGLPSTPGTIGSGSGSAGQGGSTPQPRFLRVRIKPGGKLTHTFTWWALRIPAPAPITRDDAGHRFVPKTAPVPLTPGEYLVNVELPLHGIQVPESVVSTKMRVASPDRDRDRE